MNRRVPPHHVVCISLAAVFFLAIASHLPAADWPGFRGSSHFGVSSDAKIPTVWGDTYNLKWKLKLPGAGFSSPIVVGDKILVTCYSGADGDLKGLKRHLVCVNRQTGKEVWSTVIPSTVTEQRGPRFGTDHGYASHTPVSDGERIFVLCGNSGVLAFDMKGKKLWQKSVGTRGASMFGSAASPILYKDSVIVTAASESTSIRAFDKKTGKQLWKAAADSLSRCYSTPVIVKNAKGDDEVVISVAYEVWGLNPVTGKLKWFAETDVNTAACPTLVEKDGIVYVIGGRGTGGRAAIRLSGEKGDVTKKNVLWSTRGGSYVPSPVLYKGHLYWISNSGIATCVDAKTGKEVGRKRLGGQFYASVVLIKDKLYAVSRRGGTYVLEATPKLTQISRNRLADTSDFSASPAVSNGQLILRSNKALYCIEAK